VQDAHSGRRAEGLSRLLRPGLVANIGANGLGQVFQALIQLASVPIYTHALGLERYGVWLIFATLPAYLVISDLGLTVTSANDMTARIARHDHDGARTTFRALTRSILALSAVVGLLVVIVLGWLAPSLLAAAAAACDGQPFTVLSLVLLYSLAVLQCSASFAAFRAVGEYSVAAYRLQWITLVEASAAMAAALAGYGLPGMACALGAVRTTGAVWLWLLLQARHPLFFRGPVGAVRRRGLALLRPAMAAFALPVSHLLILQGSVGLIGFLAGPAAIPAFTAIRTVTRIAIQVGMIVNNASLPNFTAAHARGETEPMHQLIGLSGIAAIVTLLPGALIMLPFGSELVGLWTSHKIDVPHELVLAMALSMLAHGIWLPLSNFLLAINRQSSFSWHYLALTMLAFAIAVAVVPHKGAAAMAWLIAAIDGAMLVLILWRVRLAGMLDRQSWSALVNGARAIREIGARQTQ